MSKISQANLPQPFLDIGDGSEDDATLYSLGSEFLEAARILMKTPPTRLGYQMPTIYLIGHSAELFLKAYLFGKDKTIVELKDVGHDLSKLLKCAKQSGLTLVDELPELKELSCMYKSKLFEYRVNGEKRFPSIESLFCETKRLEENSVYWFPANG